MSNEELARFAILAIILLFLLFSFLPRLRSNLSETFKNYLIWFGIFFLLIALYAFRFELNDFKQRILAVLIPSYSWSDQEGEITIARHQDGHFYLYVQGGSKQPVKFLIDTGATNVALTMSDAIALGVDVSNLRYTQQYSTANGVNYGAPVVIPEITIGKKKFQNVRAHLLKQGLDTSLFGMSLIDQFQDFQISRDLLILKY